MKHKLEIRFQERTARTNLEKFSSFDDGFRLSSTWWLRTGYDEIPRINITAETYTLD